MQLIERESGLWICNSKLPAADGFLFLLLVIIACS